MEQERLQHEEFLLRSKEEWQQQVIAERKTPVKQGIRKDFRPVKWKAGQLMKIC